MLSSLKADLGSTKFWLVIRRYCLMQIPSLILAVALIVSFTTTVDMLTQIHYVKRRWLIVSDFTLIFLGSYVFSYSIQNMTLKDSRHDLHNDQLEVSTAKNPSRVYTALSEFIKHSIVNLCLSIFIFYGALSASSGVPILQNYLVYNFYTPYVVTLNFLLMPTILALQIVVINIVNHVSKILNFLLTTT